MLDGLIEASIVTPKDFQVSRASDFKLAPFQNHVIGRDGLTELLTCLHEFLHNTVVILVVDGWHCETRFEEAGAAIVETVMTSRAKDVNFF